jgi:hypothetical protein
VSSKDHYAADRAAADHSQQALPDLPLIALSVRAFLTEAVRRLAVDYGIRQFLDIGTGLPTANNTHEVAQLVAPESRIVYVDNDPIVISHAAACSPRAPG